VSEPLMTCQDLGNDIKTGVSMRSRDQSDGCPFTGQMVSGMQAARAWSVASVRNVGRRVPIQGPLLVWSGWRAREGVRRAAETVRRRVPMRCVLADQLVVVMKLL
jgi:hypothetical protein